MTSWNKILCMVVVLFLLSLVVQSSCMSIEGLQNSFTNCMDDPTWFVTNRDNERFYCSDIGTRASCYDRNSTQVEGWEACLQSCGNCADVQVTQAPMNHLAYYSGDPVEQFGVVLFRDDDREWVGRGAEEESLDLQTGMLTGEDSTDVRNILGSEESEDILDIYGRLGAMESLYDMLLGNVESCVDCTSHTERDSCNAVTGCEWDGGAGTCNVATTGDGQFIGCNGQTLECQVVGPNENENEETIVHQYVKHNCDSSGNCNIQFPTYDYSCEDVANTPPTIEPTEAFTYEYTPVDTQTFIDRSKLSEYSRIPRETDTLCSFTIQNLPIVASTTADKVVMGSTSGVTNMVDMDGGVITDDSVTISDCTTDTNNGSYTVSEVELDGDNQEFTLTRGDGTPIDTTNLDSCQLTLNTRNNNTCVTLNTNEDINECATLCGEMSDRNVTYMGVSDQDCYCVDTENNQALVGDSTQDGDDNLIPLYTTGQTSTQAVSMPWTDGDDPLIFQNHCKQFFLLENSLQSETELDDLDGDEFGSSMSATDYPNRVSLYDMCPTQCQATTCQN